MTKNIIKEADSAEKLENIMNEINSQYGKNVFATQTHVTPTPTRRIYTAVFFIRDD